jgi:type I restriction enzyme R subunit
MSNFSFLDEDWADVHQAAERAEENVRRDPRAACFHARRTLEWVVEWMYDHDATLDRPHEDRLGRLIYEPTFEANLRDGGVSGLVRKVQTIHRVGNRAVHERTPVSEGDALHVVKELFHFLFWFYRTYTPGGASLSATFDADEIPDAEPDPTTTPEEIQALEEKLQQQEQSLVEKEKELEEKVTSVHAKEEEIERLEQELEQVRAELEERRETTAEVKQENQQVPDSHDYSEEETRDYFIDLLLKEAGWTLDDPDTEEYPVEGMPNDSGKGCVDYVLWGDDGRPLALVEAKRTKRDPRKGKRQAELYADCLEDEFGRRPIIFYTNGYTTWLWDDAFYPPREVQGFYKKKELERLIQRREIREPLNSADTDPTIAGRSYQQEGIQRVCERFNRGKRRALLALATGTGKTRLAISLTDLLSRQNWAKRVLFLADRNALLRQAADSFRNLVPRFSPVDITQTDEEANSRLILSTYPTMMNSIDDTVGGRKRFSPGHFDLVIIDEAHRSVYNRYLAIFDYFDAMYVGLTATPRDEVSRNTYRLFNCEIGDPTHHYSLEEGVEDGWLVPPKEVSVQTKFLREGITYEELSEEEQEEYEMTFLDEETGEIPEHIDPGALNNWLFNEDTVDRVLKHLMEEGLKVEGGDRLGKTIIFARNTKHARFIEERFDALFPDKAGKFARVIVSADAGAQSLIDDFKEVDEDPTIAISVAMLDTGIDVPEVVNLVIFKPVYSRTKFDQMIGRGVRPCEDLFGPGRDKTCFYVFDYCGNFDFFSQNPDGRSQSRSLSLSARIFKQRSEIVEHLMDAGDLDGEEEELDSILRDRMHERVAGMNPENVIVRPYRQLVDEFSYRDRWGDLDHRDLVDIRQELLELPTTLDVGDEAARRFDLLIANAQLALLDDSDTFDRLRDQIQETVRGLAEKTNIPEVAQKEDLIDEVADDALWAETTVLDLEIVREELRSLIQYLDPDRRKQVYTDFTDEMGAQTVIRDPDYEFPAANRSYRRRVKRFIREHEDHPVISKLKNNMPLTPKDLDALEDMLFESEEVGSREEFVREYGEMQTLGSFIRRLVGLDRSAAKEEFADYLEGKELSADQVLFINEIIDHLTQNGMMKPGRLYERPFTDLHSEGLDGLFRDEEADEIVRILRSINRNAVVPSG